MTINGIPILYLLTDPGWGTGAREILVSTTERIVLWTVTGCLAFAALRPLRPGTGTGR